MDETTVIDIDAISIPSNINQWSPVVLVVYLSTPFGHLDGSDLIFELGLSRAASPPRRLEE